LRRAKMGLNFFLLVASGGACGSVLRAAVGLMMKSFLPWPTLMVNVLGAFLIGFLVKFAENSTTPDSFKAFWVVGLCGGFTTFSAFGMDLIRLIEEGQWTTGFLYLGLNLFGTVFAIFLGFRVFSLVVQ